jgi:hypothetical protein
MGDYSATCACATCSRRSQVHGRPRAKAAAPPSRRQRPGGRDVVLAEEHLLIMKMSHRSARKR